MVKVTFPLDDETVERLRRPATRLGRPQSQVVRESVKEYEARSDRLSEEERRRAADRRRAPVRAGAGPGTIRRRCS